MTHEIMFCVMALRAESGYVLRQLSGFSRMHGSREKGGVPRGGEGMAGGGGGVMYQLHLPEEEPLGVSHPPSPPNSRGFTGPLASLSACVVSRSCPAPKVSVFLVAPLQGGDGGSQKKAAVTLLLERPDCISSVSVSHFTRLGCVDENLAS